MAVTLPAQWLPDDTTDPDRAEAPPERETSSPLTFLAVVGVGSLVIILCVLGAAMSGLFSFGTDSGTTSSVETTPSERVPGTSMEDGQWLVGTDIQPGNYSVTVEAGSPGCSWERNASTDGTATSVLESGVGREGETIVVSVRDTDAVFQSRDCGVWQRTGE